MTKPQTILDRDVAWKRQHAPMLIFPAILALCLTFILPTDLFSTAKWWEEQRWQQVWSNETAENPIISFLNDIIPGTAPAEAVAFSAAMIALQFTATLKIYQEGNWVRRGDDVGLGALIANLFRKEETFSNVSPSKAAWVGVWLFCVLFDAWTSYDYRSTAETNGLMTLIVHSIFAENVLSEILTGESLRYTLVVVALIWAAAKDKLGFSGNSKPKAEKPAAAQSSRPARPRRDNGSGGRPQERRPEPPRGNGGREPLATMPRPSTINIEEHIAAAMAGHDMMD